MVNLENERQGHGVHQSQWSHSMANVDQNSNNKSLTLKNLGQGHGVQISQ